MTENWKLRNKSCIRSWHMQFTPRKQFCDMSLQNPPKDGYIYNIYISFQWGIFRTSTSIGRSNLFSYSTESERPESVHMRFYQENNSFNFISIIILIHRVWKQSLNLNETLTLDSVLHDKLLFCLIMLKTKQWDGRTLPPPPPWSPCVPPVFRKPKCLFIYLADPLWTHWAIWRHKNWNDFKSKDPKCKYKYEIQIPHKIENEMEMEIEMKTEMQMDMNMEIIWKNIKTWKPRHKPTDGRLANMHHTNKWESEKLNLMN